MSLNLDFYGIRSYYSIPVSEYKLNTKQVKFRKSGKCESDVLTNVISLF